MKGLGLGRLDFKSSLVADSFIIVACMCRRVKLFCMASSDLAKVLAGERVCTRRAGALGLSGEAVPCKGMVMVLPQRDRTQVCTRKCHYLV
jgi:hypothetical protein